MATDYSSVSLLAFKAEKKPIKNRALVTTSTKPETAGRLVPKISDRI